VLVVGGLRRDAIPVVGLVVHPLRSTKCSIPLLTVLCVLLTHVVLIVRASIVRMIVRISSSMTRLLSVGLLMHVLALLRSGTAWMLGT